MTKLLISSDTLLLKRKDICNFVCNGLDHFIENGNRFLLMSRKPLQHLFDIKLPGGMYLPTVNLINNERFRYTDVSCLNGLFLYDSNNNLLNYIRIESESILRLHNYVRNKGCVESFIVTPDGAHSIKGNLNDTIVGSVKFSITKGPTLNKLKVELKKLANELGLIICSLDKCDVVFEYDARKPKSNEITQKEFLKDKYNVLDGDSLTLDKEVHSDIQIKIKEFMRQ